MGLPQLEWIYNWLVKRCPQCNYLLDAFDMSCPRCRGGVVQPEATIPVKKPVETTPETVGSSLRGGLVALIPAFIITLSFTFHWACNAVNRDKHGITFSFASYIAVILLIPLCILKGVAIGACDWL